MRQGVFVFFIGLLAMMLGMGCMENSVETVDLIAGFLATVTGLAIAWAGIRLVQRR